MMRSNIVEGDFIGGGTDGYEADHRIDPETRALHTAQKTFIITGWCTPLRNEDCDSTRNRRWRSPGTHGLTSTSARQFGCESGTTIPPAYLPAQEPCLATTAMEKDEL